MFAFMKLVILKACLSLVEEDRIYWDSLGELECLKYRAGLDNLGKNNLLCHYHHYYLGNSRIGLRSAVIH